MRAKINIDRWLKNQKGSPEDPRSLQNFFWPVLLHFAKDFQTFKKAIGVVSALTNISYYYTYKTLHYSNKKVSHFN